MQIVLEKFSIRDTVIGTKSRICSCQIGGRIRDVCYKDTNNRRRGCLYGGRIC